MPRLLLMRAMLNNKNSGTAAAVERRFECISEHAT